MKTPSGLRPGELVFVLVLLAFSLMALREAYAISGFAGLATGGVLPMLAASVMAVSGLVILHDVVRRRTRDQRASLSEMIGFLLPARFLLFAALIILYALTIPWIGFIVASGGFLFLSVAILWRRGVVWSAVVALVSISAVYVVFRLIFQVVLPTGSLWS